jgi:hypothetical protein
MNRPVRLLLPWFEPRDAVSALLGFRVPDRNEDLSRHVAVYEQQRRALAARPSYAAPPPVLEPVPKGFEDRAAKFRAAIGAADTLRVGVVDLHSLLSFQKIVALDHIEDRVGETRPDDWQALFDLCLPVERPDEAISGTYDRDGKALTITSMNPNLRASAVQQVSRPTPTGEQQMVGFNLSFGSNFLNVVAYRGRAFLKDGYHRSYGLIKRGIRYAPCAFSETQTFSDVHGGGPSHVTQEYLLGTHPPYVKDFHDESVSAASEQRSFRKVVRITVQEFVIHL